jgi:uncharacterized protein (DUF2249 family)/quercetin dioxygenase-like cupin family protein
LSDEKISRRILMEDPVMRVVLVSLRAGQSLPEHAANGLVTVYSVGGRVLFYERAECSEMAPGSLVRLEPSRPHRLDAKEDSRLLVTMIKPSDAAAWNALSPRGRLGPPPNPSRTTSQHRVYAFDTLEAGESFLLVNDHDPQPLHAQMDQVRPGEVAWEYELQGPCEFRIKISRIARSAVAASGAVLASCSH